MYLLIFFQFIQNIIKNVAKNLFATSIYLARSEFCTATEAYLIDNYAEYFENLSEKC